MLHWHSDVNQHILAANRKSSTEKGKSNEIVQHLSICIRTTMVTAIISTKPPMNVKMCPAPENDLHMNSHCKQKSYNIKRSQICKFCSHVCFQLSHGNGFRFKLIMRKQIHSWLQTMMWHSFVAYKSLSSSTSLSFIFLIIFKGAKFWQKAIVAKSKWQTLT